jgi:hypothetical protein
VRVVGRRGEDERVADLLEAQLAGHEPLADAGQLLELGGRSDPLPGGVTGDVAAVGEPVGHRQRPVGPVVLQGVGGQDHPERFVEQDVAVIRVIRDARRQLRI